MTNFILDVAKDFTPMPYGRYRKDDEKYSAEVFREETLLPLLDEYDHVVVDLSGSNFFGSSFLEEVFGGIIRNHKEYTRANLLNKLEVKHTLLPSIEAEVKEYINNA